MIGQEIIKELSSVKPKDDFEEVAEDIDMMEEDIDLACDALVEDDDCISREEAVYIAKHECNHLKIAIMLEELPPVNPKSGK